MTITANFLCEFITRIMWECVLKTFFKLGVGGLNTEQFKENILNDILKWGKKRGNKTRNRTDRFPANYEEIISKLNIILQGTVNIIFSNLQLNLDTLVWLTMRNKSSVL